MALSNSLRTMLNNMNKRARRALLGTRLQNLIAGTGMDLVRGALLRGSSSGASEALVAKTDKQILIGDGSDVNSKAISGDISINNLGKVNLKGGALKVVAAGSKTLDEAGDDTDSVNVISNAAIQAGDIAIVSLVTDDTGTTITRLESVIAAGSLTITRTDDASSNDDAVVDYVIVRGDEGFVVGSGTATLSTGGGAEEVAVVGAVASDVVALCLVSDDTGTPIPYTALSATAGTDKIDVVNAADDGTTADDAVIQYVVFRPAKSESTLVSSGKFIITDGNGASAHTDSNIKAGDIAVCSLVKDDTGASITSFVGVCTANTLTVTCDNGTSNDGVMAYQIFRRTPVVANTATLSTGGGVHAITDLNIGANDIAIVNLESDDSGTPIVKLVAAVTEDTLTITRTDDGSSADDAECHYVVIRP